MHSPHRHQARHAPCHLRPSAKTRLLGLGALCLLVFAGPGLASDAKAEILPAVARAVAAADRDPLDLRLDAGRKPAETLSFFGFAPGMRVAEIGSGTGYTAELLARIVGDEGRVFAQNPRFVLEKFAEAPWSKRLQKPVMAPVVRVDREFDAPLPEEATNLDVVLNVLFYHDTVWMEIDREQMNRAIFEALKPGGVYAIVDHAAARASGTTVTKSLHRIEERVLRQEILSAGFVLEAEADFLRNPEDQHDWNASPSASGERRGTSDRFVLRFRKPG